VRPVSNDLNIPPSSEPTAGEVVLRQLLQTRDAFDSVAADYDGPRGNNASIQDMRAEMWRTLDVTFAPGARLLDLGCGTGSLSVLLAEQGYGVRGLDLSERMITAATRKAHAAGVEVDFQQGDASVPPYGQASADVVLARHVLWALPDPSQALASWIQLLRPAGRLVLIEGCWTTGAGLTADQCQRLVGQRRTEATVERLDDPTLWGRQTHDERYALVSRT